MFVNLVMYLQWALCPCQSHGEPCVYPGLVMGVHTFTNSFTHVGMDSHTA